jgi:hypothetical protein
MVETRSGKGAGAQTSFWALAFIMITAGIGVIEGAGEDQTRLIIGLCIVIAGVSVIFAKYYLKLPDVSEKEMQDTLAVFASTYEELVKQAGKVYNEDLHAYRDEIVKHRALIKATAAMLPAKYQLILNDILDNIDAKYAPL